MLSPLLVGKVKRSRLETGMLRPLDSDFLWKLDGKDSHIDFLRTKSLDYPVCLPWLHEQDLDHLTLEFLGKFN